MPKSPEKLTGPETEIKDIEAAPFQERETEVVQSLTEKYADKTEISEKSKKVVDGFLARDTEEVFKRFALKWFKDNEDLIKQEGIVVPPGASDEWKSDMVLRTRENGGMGAKEDIRKPGYEEMGTEADMIGVLRTDMAKDQIPPVTPLLLLNHLQSTIGRERQEIDKLRVEAEKGDQSAAVLADSKERQLKGLYLDRKELAEKTMGEDLTAAAEKRVYESGLNTKEDYVNDNIDARAGETGADVKQELREKEWQSFSNLSEEDKKACRKKIGYKEHVTRAEFVGTKYRRSLGQLGEREEAKAYDKYNFLQSMRACADNFGKNAFYGLLDQGYKPYEVKPAGFRILKSKRFLMPKQGGFIQEVPVEKYEDFLKQAEETYLKNVETRAKGKLEEEWAVEHNQDVNDEIERCITELAESPEKAEGGLERLYQIRRDRIVTEYTKKLVEKEPKTKEQLAKIEKRFGEKGEKRNINDFMSDVLFQKGRLEDLGEELDDEGRGDMRGFLRDWGIQTTPKMTKGITKEKYRKARKTRMGLFGIIMGLVDEAFKPKASKK